MNLEQTSPSSRFDHSRQSACDDTPVSYGHRMTQGYIQAEFEYDTLGRLLRTTSRDLSARTSLTIERDYDDLGRETLRTLKPSDQPARIVRQSVSTSMAPGESKG